MNNGKEVIFQTARMVEEEEQTARAARTGQCKPTKIKGGGVGGFRHEPG